MTPIWLRQASDVSTSSRPSHRSPPRQFPIVMTSSCRLQSTSRLSHLRHPGRIPGPPWVFIPFSAIITGRAQQASRLTAPRSQVFSTSQQVPFAPRDSWVYSTPLALLGCRPSELDPESIGIRLPDPLLLRRSLPFMGFFPG